MVIFPLYSSILVFAVAVAAAWEGIRLTSVPALSKLLVPFSGGLLLGIASFWVVPEMAVFFGWTGVMLWATSGFALLFVIDRYLHPLCPSCSHTHDHDGCSARLHGFAAPMLIAAAVHSFFDGWTLAASSQEAVSFGTQFLIGIALHKIPEGLTLGVIVRSAVRSRAEAFWGCVAAESVTIAGAALEMAIAPHVAVTWMHGLLALAAGGFVYLGYHAVHGEFRRRGMPAFYYAIPAAAVPSVLKLLASIR